MEVMERCVRYRVMMVFTVFQFLIVDFALFVDSFFITTILQNQNCNDDVFRPIE